MSRKSRASRDRRRGFTVIEAFIVLVILGLAAAVGSVAFRKWTVRARAAEAHAMLADIADQENAFRAGGGRYMSLRSGPAQRGASDEAAAAFYPLPADSPELASARTSVRVDDADRWPAAWRALGVRPRADHLYCTYLVNAGDDGIVPAGLKLGAALLEGAPPGPWFYALAACNLAGASGYPDEVTIYGVSSQSAAVRTFNEGR